MNEDDDDTEEELSEEELDAFINPRIIARFTDLYDEINFLKIQIKRLQASLLMLTKTPPPPA